MLFEGQICREKENKFCLKICDFLLFCELGLKSVISESSKKYFFAILSSITGIGL